MVQEEEDYYTEAMFNRLWMPDWYSRVLQNGPWFTGSIPKQQTINQQFQFYYPYVCHSCKRGPLMPNVNLLVCSSCRVIKYCCQEHQQADWKNHRTWCNAFKAFRSKMDSMNQYSSRQEWSEAIPLLIEAFRDRYFTRRHSIEAQLIAMQPRCRKCFTAGLEKSVTLIPCPQCSCVALCSDCAQTETNFHWDSSSGDPRHECSQHLLSLCCTGMVVEQGQPLGYPSATDELILWYPKDWIEYFARKRGDFEFPAAFLTLAPVVCFLTDHLSTVMTLHHVLMMLLPEVNHRSDCTELVIHVCGAADVELQNFESFLELSRLNPSLQQLTVRLIGPNCYHRTTQTLQNALNACRIRESCQITMTAHPTLYHEAGLPEVPTVAICPNSGIDDSGYTSQWRPTLELLGFENVPIILTGFNRKEVLDDCARIATWGIPTIVPPRNNPFHGLRPYPDPSRDPNDLIYNNSTFAIARGITM